MAYAAFRSIGAYLPEEIRTNQWFVDRMDTSDEWITQRTGIKERRVAAPDENTSDLGAKAAKVAIERAGIDINDIDLVVCATLSPDYLTMPSTACIIADKLGIKGAMSMDISAACSGFIYALSVARAYIESGMKKNVLIIGAEKATSLMDYTDRTTCMLFGDGAGAAVISATDNKDEAIIDVNCGADGGERDILETPAPYSGEASYMKMNGNKTFKIAVKRLTSDAQMIMERNNFTNKDIDLFVPHQANSRIMDVVARNLEFEESQQVVTVDKYANTSAATIPIAMNEAFENGRVKDGSILLFDAFGGGATWGSALVKFSPNK